MDKEKLETAVAAMLAESGFEITDFKLLRQNGKPLLQFFVDRATPNIPIVRGLPLTIADF